MLCHLQTFQPCPAKSSHFLSCDWWMCLVPQTNIEAIQEDVVVALESKNPQVKVETASFLTRCFTKCTPTMLNKKVLKAYATVLLKMLIDPGGFSLFSVETLFPCVSFVSTYFLRVLNLNKSLFVCLETIFIIGLPKFFQKKKLWIIHESICINNRT